MGKQRKEPSKATEEGRSPFLAWKLLYARTARSASPTMKKVRKFALSERGRRCESDTKGGEKEMRDTVSKVMAQVIRYEDAQGFGKHKTN